METETILNLKKQLREAENEQRKAAQYGLHLLESHSEVQNQLDQARRELTEKTEKFEQDKYSLQREIDLKNRMLESLNFECESLKQQQNVQLDKQKEQLARVYGREISDLKNKLENLKAELDETRLSEKQLRHKVDHQKEIIAAKSEELHMMSERVHETMSSEMLSLQIELTELESVKANIEEKLNELQYSKEQLELLNSNLHNQLERVQGEKEEREKEIVYYCNELEKAHEANQELQVQLDQAVQQSLDPASKGNSLFAEVEDRRAEMERQLISVKIKYQSLQKQHAFTREQLQRMKMQMATLLQMKVSQAEYEQLERLQSMVEQKNGEVEDLLFKVRQLEKFKTLYENMEESRPRSSPKEGESEDGYYTDLLLLKLDKSKKETETLKNELSLQRMKALYESQRVLEVERKLFAIERRLQACQSDNMNLRVKLDELQMKYEPGEIFKDTEIKKEIENIPVDATSEYLDSKNTSASEAALTQSPLKEETKITSKNLEKSDPFPKTRILEAPQINIAFQALQKVVVPERGRKRVKSEDDNHDASTSCSRSGSNSLTSAAPRSVSASVYGQGNQQRPASLFFRCLNYAIQFFICFLSVACSVIPQLRLPTLNISIPFRKTKMMTNEKDS
ncbi:protein Spindly isoform X1 [Falco biarmicus]|uniref:protein Spindly isoform X1 n=1 Tax=Falco biarmicus TaxID=345155 RepID=UPI0024BC91B6|nr:protein Spindly isoform X1 [Falco biarmicus]XP_056205631.1 protein Spindly isoform X1 [Falco biarmicus]XP_056205632.1 protein Spindly isoform X1 [Falco biarmicus]XP_056205633.1 protein Spindly isoform X1 [Falco biarmicus]XP_056205634.1 protein Spindly isoform X1 [Falco biarmicus]XP_056205635.1 protein Spindly isoform X1 [Falco biarmicus]